MAGENRNGAVELDWADGRHRFRLALGELEELQEKTGVGPFVLLQRLISGDWRTADVRETLRIGLIGGGLKPLEALPLIRRYVDGSSHWIENAMFAKVVVMAAISGAPEEEPGKSDAPEAETEVSNSPTDALLSASSTEQPELQE